MDKRTYNANMEPIPKNENRKEKENGEGEMSMDYAKIASQVIANVGGKENIKSAAHCATRLRLQLKNNDLRNEDAISDLEGVKGVFLTQSQFQIIFGSGLVNLIFAEVQKQLGESVEQAAKRKKNRNRKGIFCSGL